LLLAGSLPAWSAITVVTTVIDKEGQMPKTKCPSCGEMTVVHLVRNEYLVVGDDADEDTMDSREFYRCHNCNGEWSLEDWPAPVDECCANCTHYHEGIDGGMVCKQDGLDDPEDDDWCEGWLAKDKIEHNKDGIAFDANGNQWQHDGNGRYVRLEPLSILGCSFHVEAIAVEDRDGNQRAVDSGQDDLDHVTELAGDAPLATITLDGRACVVFMTPYSA
jgi:hypothetical protein